MQNKVIAATEFFWCSVMQMRAEFIPLPVSAALHRTARCAEMYL